MKAWLLLGVMGASWAQTLPQDRMRTGMAEAGVRYWNVTREGDGAPYLESLSGVSFAGFVTDNLAVGGLVSVLSTHSVVDEFCLDALARFYFAPLERSTPWMELRLGGLIQPTGQTGATHLGVGFGWRWRPLEWMALDLQFAGFERWGYDDPNNASNGNSDWSLQKGPVHFSWGDSYHFRLWPTPSLHFLF